MTQEINKTDYSFSNSEGFLEGYRIAKTQFKNIMLNFDEENFHKSFIELFFGRDDYYKLFMRKKGRIICGTLSYIFDSSAFCDIFFWNNTIFKRNDQEFRFFCEDFFKKTRDFGIENMIVPMDKTRKRHNLFKKYCESLYSSKEEYIFRDEDLKREYSDHYLLKVNYEKYFNQRKIINKTMTNANNGN